MGKSTNTGNNKNEKWGEYVMRKTSKIFSILLVVVFILSSFNGVSFADETNDNIHITILGTSDIHSNLYGYTYEDQVETTNNGAARIYSYIKQVRKENPNTILIDNGDTYQGTILADAIYNKKLDTLHPVTKVLNHMGFDAMILGNHEYNFGMEFLEKIINELEMPVLAANARYKDGRDLGKPYIILEKQGIKIGILGITNPNAPRWDGEKVDDLEFDSVYEAGKKYAKILKEDEKVDLLFVSAHVGLIPEYDEENGSDGAERLLKEVPEIDAALLGHYHTVSADSLGEIIYGSPRNAGRDVVRFDFEIEQIDGKFVVADKAVITVDMQEVEPNQEIRDLIEEEHKFTIDFINGEGSSEDGEMGGGIFGEASADFQPKNEIEGIPEGKLRDTAVIELIAKVQLEISGADVTGVALFQDNSDIKTGPINYGDLFNIYKFDNTLYTVDVTGKELIDYMEWSALHYNTWKPGDINISFDENVPGYLYDMFKGVDYKVDLSKPAGERIVDVRYKGEPLKEDEVLTLAVNNYRYSSGLKGYKLVEANRKWESPKAIREYLAEYIQEKGVIDPIVSNNWEITGVDLEHPLRDEIIQLVNDKKLPIPYNHSLNIDELEEMGIIVDGKVVDLEDEVDQELSHSEGPTRPKADDKQEDVEEQQVTEYIVKSGDVLWKIAEEYGKTWEELAEFNKLKNPHLIYPEQVIRIP